MNSLLHELPFYNNNTSDIIKFHDRSERQVKTIIESYGVPFKRIIYRLKAANAYIGGSTATLAHFKNTVTFTPGDIDLYIEDTGSHRNAAKSIVTVIKSSGYVVDIENSFTDFLGDVRTQYTPDNKHIREIWSLKNDVLKKCIQIVLLDMDPRKYIIEETDLSCTSIAIQCHTENVTFAEENRSCMKRNEFYVNEAYHDIYDGKRGKKRQEKLMYRIRKYEERGFKFIGKSPDPAANGNECFRRFDSIPKEAKKHMIHSINDYDDVTLYAGLQRADSIVIYVNKEKGYLVNRQQFYEYCNENDKTYWGQHLYRNGAEMTCAPILLFEMYRLFVLRKVHTCKYIIEPKMIGDIVDKEGIHF